MDHLERLIVDMKESLEREIRAVNDNLERKIEDGFKQVNTRFDTRRCDSTATVLYSRPVADGPTG